MKNLPKSLLKKHMIDIAKETARQKESVSTGLITHGLNLQKKNNPAA